MKNKLLVGVILGVVIGAVGYWGVTEYSKMQKEKDLAVVADSYMKAKDKTAFLKDYLSKKNGSKVELSNSSADEGDEQWIEVHGCDNGYDLAMYYWTIGDYENADRVMSMIADICGREIMP